jgi:hypothetical protein
MSRSPLLLGITSERDMATRLAQMRITVGSTSLFATGLARVAFGVNAQHDNASARALARLFGIRNIVLGAWILGVRDADAEARRLCYKLNMVVDAVDVGVLLWPLLRRAGTARFSLSAASLGTAATLAWMDLLDVSSAEGVA